MKIKLALLGAAMLAAGTANAQSFNETFDGKTIANLQSSGWSFGGATPAILSPVVGDLALLFDASATFSFTVTNATPFYLVSFYASRPTVLDTNYLDVTFRQTNVPGLNLTQRFEPLPTTGVFGADPLGTRFSYYFGSPVTPGTYSLQFQNGGGFASTVTLDSLSITAVPEPETYALMLAGLGVVGFLARRRKSDSTGATRSQGAVA